MSQLDEYFKQSELALAAYGDFAIDEPDLEELIAADFSQTQANFFIPKYRIVDQYNDPNSGLSATIFRHADDVFNTNSILAIRGTELSDINDLFAGLSIALIGDTTKLQPQYTSLKAKVTEWLTNGTISPTFTVTGHSLGGFLATGLTTDFPGNVSHAYLYNTPGVGGVFGSMTNAILDFLGIAQTYDPGKFSNIEAATGISPIAGLGYDVSPPIDILIENQLNPDVTNAPASKNHSQQVLTDTLAVYSLYSQLLPSFDQNQLNALINAFGSINDTQGSNSTTLESALDALRTIVLNPGNGQIILDDTHKTARGDRDAFYTNFESLNGNQALITLSGTAQLTLLSELNANQIITMAIDNGAQGMAARFALSALNPFVLEGIDYSAFNNNNVLDLFNPASGAGMISDQYLEDRVTMLVRKLWFNTNDENPYNPSAQVDSHNFNIHQYLKSDIYFEDAATGYKIQQGGLFANTPRYYFGDDTAETPAGSASKDRLYGGGGDDMLQGLEGNDYLEGGMGVDTYIVNAGDGVDTILDVIGLSEFKISFGCLNNVMQKARGISIQYDPVKYLN